jgi:hypothetical protein
MRLLAFLMIVGLLMCSSPKTWAKEPTAEELRQQCERDINCARRNGPNDTEFVPNATDPELCKDGTCARHVHAAYPNDALSRPDAIRPTGQSSPAALDGSNTTQ